MKSDAADRLDRTTERFHRGVDNAAAPSPANLELKKRTGLVSVIPEGATVCGWCAEFEDAARRTSEYALKLDESERRNNMLHESIARVTRQLRENNCDEVERLKRELRWANEGWQSAFRCPLCDYRPEVGARSPLRSLRAHLRRKHRLADTTTSLGERRA